MPRGGVPKKPEDRHSVRVNFMAKKDEHQGYLQKAKDEGVTLAEWIRRSLYRAMKKKK